MNSSSQKTLQELPFLHLLSEADRFSVEELHPAEKGSVTQFLSTLSDLRQDETHGTRAFVVKVKQAMKPDVTKANPTAPSRIYLMRSAELLLQDHDYILARNLYSYLLKVNIRDVEALKGLGICLMRLKDIRGAMKCFRAAREISGNEEFSLWIAQCFVAENEIEKALGEFREIREPKKLKLELQFDYFKEFGNCETKMALYDSAKSHYEKALSLMPRSDAVWVNLGTVLLNQKEYAQASSQFEKALSLNPKNSRAHCGLGLVLLETGNVAEAEKKFHEALEQDPLNSVALYQLLAISFKSGNTEGVLFRIQNYLQKNPNDLEIRYALCVIHFKKSEWRHCEAEVEKILVQDPSHSRGRALKEQLVSHRYRATP